MIIMISIVFDYCFCLVITNYQTENRYRIRNALGQQIYFAAERKCLIVKTSIFKLSVHY